jgi:uncharacterized protein (DUF2384 family)
MNTPPQVISVVEQGLKARGESVEAFCKAVHIHRATWQRWKAGKTSPTLRESQKMIEVARDLGIELTAEHFIQAA